MANFRSRFGAALGIALALGMLVAQPADARRGGSFGSRGSRTYAAPRSTVLASTRSFDQWVINALIQNSDASSIHPYTSDLQDCSIEEIERHLFDREPDGLRRGAKASVTNRAAASFTSRRKEIGRRVVVKSGHSPS